MNSILVVDDQALVRRAVIRELGDHFEITEAKNYEQARILLTTNSFGAIVGDCRMGKGPGGLQLMEFARENDPGARRVLVSATVLDDNDAEAIVSAGVAHRVLTKPWAPNEVFEALRDLIAH